MNRKQAKQTKRMENAQRKRHRSERGQRMRSSKASSLWTTATLAIFRQSHSAAALTLTSAITTAALESARRKTISAAMSNSNLGATAVSATTELSREELRHLRLVAMGLANPIDISKRDIVDLIDGDTNEEKQKISIKGNQPTSALRQKRKNPVIDLLDSSDDEDLIAQSKRLDEIKKTRSEKARKLSRLSDGNSSSEDSLLADSRALDDRKRARAKHAQPNASHAISRKPPDISSARNASSENLDDDSKPPAKKRKSSKGTDRLSSESSVRGSRAGAPAQRSFQIATWNVWFGPMGDGTPHPGLRMRTLTRILKEQPRLWCVGFQEVIDPLAQYLKPSVEHAGYRWFRQEHVTYGCALAIHNSLCVLEHGWMPYSATCMQRGFLFVRVQLPNSGDQLIFTTTHLESFSGHNYTGADQRPPQLKEMERFCNEHFSRHASLKAAIMTGDMNWDDERPTARSKGTDPPMLSIVSDKWADAWLSTKPSDKKATCYTYDGKVNPMLGGNLRRRFDRCLLRAGNGSKVVAKQSSILGVDAIPDITWQKYNSYKQTSKEMPLAPSDHFGFVVDVQME